MVGYGFFLVFSAESSRCVRRNQCSQTRSELRGNGRAWMHSHISMSLQKGLQKREMLRCHFDDIQDMQKQMLSRWRYMHALQLPDPDTQCISWGLLLMMFIMKSCVCPWSQDLQGESVTLMHGWSRLFTWCWPGMKRAITSLRVLDHPISPPVLQYIIHRASSFVYQIAMEKWHVDEGQYAMDCLIHHTSTLITVSNGILLCSGSRGRSHCNWERYELEEP